MMKVILIACLCMGMIPLSASAGQNDSYPSSYECLYEYEVKNSKSTTDTYTTILQIGRNCSCFMDYSAFQSDSVNAVPNSSTEEKKKYQMQKMKNNLFFDQTVLQNYPQGEMSVYSVIPPDNYVYKEKLRSIQWSLVNETDTVCGYACKKATGEYGGRKWIVWYAPEIPATFGPWKFCGLPGRSESTGTHPEDCTRSPMVHHKGSPRPQSETALPASLFGAVPGSPPGTAAVFFYASQETRSSPPGLSPVPRCVR